jgi:hypothetical protein
MTDRMVFCGGLRPFKKTQIKSTSGGLLRWFCGGPRRFQKAQGNQSAAVVWRMGTRNPLLPHTLRGACRGPRAYFVEVESELVNPAIDLQLSFEATLCLRRSGDSSPLIQYLEMSFEFEGVQAAA